MKKIIALAVASAFVAPAMAADVTVSGDVEYTYTDSNAVQEFDSGDQDVVVAASEELDNGMVVSVALEMDGNEDGLNSDSVLSITSGVVTFMIGDATEDAISMYDAKSMTSEKGGEDSVENDENGAGESHAAALVVNPVEGLNFAISMGTDKRVKSATQDLTADPIVVGVAGHESLNTTSYAVEYSAMGFSLAYGVLEKDEEDEDQSSVSLSYKTGPFYVGYDAIEGFDFDKDSEVRNLGASFDYGQGKIFVESGEHEAKDTGATDETLAVGASYKLGGAVNLYIVANQIEATTSASADATSDDQTIMGIEYSF